MSIKLNENNKLCNLEDIQAILLKGNIHIKPKEIKHYIIAFTHRSYCKSNTPRGNTVSYNPKIVKLQDNSQEVFEFIGDSIICKTVCLYLYNRYQFYEEGNLTRFE